MTPLTNYHVRRKTQLRIHQSKIMLDGVWPVPQQNPAQAPRPVLFIPGVLNPNRQVTVALELLRPLQVGSNAISQVWIIQTGVAKRARPVEAPETVLVLKIIQPSMSWWPGEDEPCFGYYIRPHDLATGEVSVYQWQRLAGLQGVVVPYFLRLSTVLGYFTHKDEEYLIRILVPKSRPHRVKMLGSSPSSSFPVSREPMFSLKFSLRS
ncbi:hypothetical protein B0H14DRAFT_2566174 [Mycena olivaceomarginata]|nr:hypothetical protein B0H14DRAFT_2566174 [Mycena olivaceomarginata]